MTTEKILMLTQKNKIAPMNSEAAASQEFSPDSPSEQSFFTLHLDGFTIHTLFGSGSIRLSNLPKNLSLAGTYIATTAYGILNSVGARDSDLERSFSFVYGENNAHYIFHTNSTSIETKHILNKITSENPCNLSDWSIYSFRTDTGTLINMRDPTQSFRYDAIANWCHSTFSRRWLDPASEGFETCFKSWINMADQTLGQCPELVSQEKSSLGYLGLSLAALGTIGFFGYNMYQSLNNQMRIDEIIGKPDSKNQEILKKIAQIERLPDLVIPEDYKCPISKCLMVEPIQLDDGHFYDRSSIIMYLENNSRAVCPLNPNYKVELRFYPTNVFMKNEIENYVNQQLQTLEESVSPRLN